MADRVVIVGGGLAGLAAASALGPRGFDVTLLESRNRLGGRASSFVDQKTGEQIDNCQHVTLGCCTNFFHFCRTIGSEPLFRREERLTFIGPDGATSELAACGLPAPLHLAPAFARLRFLSWTEKYRLALGLRALARTNPALRPDESFLDWLKRHRQPQNVIDRFWHVVLVSALSETLDRIDVGHARKVFVDGFLRHRAGWEVWVPTVTLDALYGETLRDWCAAHRITLRLQSRVKQVCLTAVSGPCGEETSLDHAFRASGVELLSGEFLPADYIILAVPQNLVGDLLPCNPQAVPELAALAQLETAPISSVHLWYDRPITSLRHATFVDRLSQWLFNRSAIYAGISANEPARAHYYQVVISASREVTARPQEETIRQVAAELARIWPESSSARLVHSRLVTEHRAVVSMLPGVDRLRPAQQSSIENLCYAGDWTLTGWPGTMEGAVRSGYLAAERILERQGRPESLVQADLPTACLSRLLFSI